MQLDHTGTTTTRFVADPRAMTVGTTLEPMVKTRSRTRIWIRRIALFVLILAAGAAFGRFLIARADGPVGVFAGGPFRTGELVPLGEIDWRRLDAESNLELELVAEATSLTLWFSVHEGVPYVACDLDCVGGRLTRWPQQVERDDRVVVRIAGQRADARLVHVPHGTPEYQTARAARLRKFSGQSGAFAAVEVAAHDTVVDVGEQVTGRAKRGEPGDRLYRLVTR